MSKSATVRLTNVLAKRIAINSRPINIVEDEGLTELLQTASNDPSYKPLCKDYSDDQNQQDVWQQKEKQT